MTTPLPKPSPSWRPNVAALIRCQGRFVVAKRHDMEVWQTMQGGIDPGETPEQALLREMREELGVEAHDVRVSYRSGVWRRYRFPPEIAARDTRHVGQEQMWFLVDLPDPQAVSLQRSEGEFAAIKWVETADEILDGYVYWKKDVFRDFLHEVSQILKRPML